MTWATERLEALKAGEITPPPVVQTMKLGLFDDWGEGWVRKSWEPCAETQNHDGSLFGGYIAALADQTIAFATMSVVPAEMVFRTINLQVNFIRVVRSQSLRIEAKVVAQTRQMITVRAEFRREDGELVAEATGQQLLMSFDRWPAERAAMTAQAPAG